MSVSMTSTTRSAMTETSTTTELRNTYAADNTTSASSLAEPGYWRSSGQLNRQMQF